MPARSWPTQKESSDPNVLSHAPLSQEFPNIPETAGAATAWFERLGANLVGRGNPSFETRRLGNCGTDVEQLAYTLFSTDKLEAAVALAEAWPLLARGGGVEVGELTVLEPCLRASM